MSGRRAGRGNNYAVNLSEIFPTHEQSKINSNHIRQRINHTHPGKSSTDTESGSERETDIEGKQRLAASGANEMKSPKRKLDMKTKATQLKRNANRQATRQRTDTKSPSPTHPTTHPPVRQPTVRNNNNSWPKGNGQELDKVAKGCVCGLAIISKKNQSRNVPQSKGLATTRGRDRRGRP